MRDRMLGFWKIESGRWVQGRLQRERAAVEKRSLKSVEAAQNRWRRSKTSDASPEHVGNDNSLKMQDAESNSASTEHMPDACPDDASRARVNSNFNKKEERKVRKNPPTPGWGEGLPDWIPRQAWDDFVAMRKSIRKPLTEAGAKLLIKKLAGFRAEGINLEAALNQSTLASWQGVQKPKNEPTLFAAGQSQLRGGL